MNNQQNTSIIFNEDFMHFVMTRYDCGISVTREVIESFIDQYAGTQVVDFIINLNASLSYCPSEVLQTSFQKFMQKKENGLPVDYSNTYLALSYDIFINKGLDLYEIMISRLRRNGICPWLSFRMNDIHDSNDPTGIRASDYRYEARERGLCRIAHRPIQDYFDNCLNFMIEEVRERWLAYINEQLTRYNVDGIELDFMREPFCFCPGDEGEGREILTEFIRSVKDIAMRHCMERGNRMRMMVRIPPDPVQAYDLGFDVYTWIRDKLVDILVVTPRWATCDSTMPVDSWVRIFESDPVEIAAGLEILCANRADLVMDNLHCYNTPEMARGFAVQYLSAGCDRIYLFNYMDRPSTTDRRAEGTMKLGMNKIISDPEAESAVAACVYKDVLSTIGQLKTLTGLPRRHVLTYRDLVPYWEPRKEPLPFRVAPSQHHFLNIKTGEVPSNFDAMLLLGISDLMEINDLSVWCNCMPCHYICRTDIFPRYTNNTVYTYQIRSECLKQFSQIIEVTSKDYEVTIDYAEIRIQPKSNEVQ